MVDCGTSRSMRSIAPRPLNAASGTGFRSAFAGKSANALSTSVAASFSSIADDRDHQLVAGDSASGGLDEIGPLDLRERLERALRRLAVRVMGKGLRLPVAVGEG